MPKQGLIAIVGPTASGKSDIAVAVARLIGGEIISADSRQVYRGLDIGTGKISRPEMRGVPHHLLDVADPKRQFAVVRYQKLAKKAIRDIKKRGKVPIVCGGTGLYIDALLYDIHFPSVSVHMTLRKKLEHLETKKLFALLRKKDVRRAATIDRNNRRRLIRALEIIDAEKNVPSISAPIFSADAKAGRWKSPYHPLVIGIRRRPDHLRERIDRRLQKRLPGIIREIKKLRASGISWERLESFGLEYRWGALFVQKKLPPHAYENPTSAGIRMAGFSETDMNALYSVLRTKIWQYAKRQLTWLKRNPNIVWIKNGREALSAARKYLKTMT